MTGYHSDLRGAEKATGGFAQRIKDLLSPRNVIAGAGLFGIGMGVRQLVGYAGEAAAAFSDLQQTGRTVEQVFGDSAATIEAWAARAADAAGMSKAQVNESASVMGQTLLNMGFDAETAAGKVVLLQQRAADMALAFGKDPQDAILAISAALRGERDTIEKFGVSLTESLVQARIDTLGLSTTTPELERYAKVAATLDLVFEQTAGSANRYADSQDDVAVKTAQAQAKIDNFMADSVGPAVASIQLGAVKVGEAFVGATEDVGTFFDDIFSPEKQAKVQQLADSWGVSFDEARQRIVTSANEGGVEFGAELDHWVALTEGAGQELGNAGERAGKDLGTGLTRSLNDVERSARTVLTDPLVAAMLDGMEGAEELAGKTPSAIAQALLDNQFSVEDAMAELARVAEESIHPLIERSQIIGFLSSEELADGLESNDPAIRAASLALQEAALSRLDELDGLAWTYGDNMTKTFAAGIVNSLGVVRDASRQLGGAAAGSVRIESEPPDRSSPLYGITKWGGNIVQTIAEGIYGNLGTGSAAAAALAGALVPSVAGGGMGAYTAGGPGEGKTVNYNLSVNGVPYEVKGVDEMIDTLLNLGAMGGEGRL